MNPGKLSLICFLLLPGCGIVAGCGRQKDTNDSAAADTRFDENKSLFGAIQKANQLILYEGLPHPTYELKQLEEEKRTKVIVTLHGFPFYHDPLDPNAEEKTKLRNLLEDEASFDEWQGERKCGGFHPDYLAEWRVGDITYKFLICFGCREMKVYGPDKSLRCDIRPDAYKQLRELLKDHRKNRPLTQEPYLPAL